MTDDIRSAAEQMMQGRLDAVDAVASRGREVEQKRAALEDAERAYASDYKAAQDAGWSDKELRQLGLPTPTRKTPGRPRKHQHTSAKEMATKGVASNVQ